MSDLKHTPGPWCLDGNKIQVQHVCINGLTAWFTLGRIDPLDDESVAGYTDGFFNPDMSMANAQLIVTAPEMFEALEAVNASWLEEFPDGPDTQLREGCAIHEDTVKIWKQIQSVINKARGLK